MLCSILQFGASYLLNTFDVMMRIHNVAVLKFR